MGIDMAAANPEAQRNHLAGLLWRLIMARPINIDRFPSDACDYDDAESALIDMGLVETAKEYAALQRQDAGQ